MGDGGLLPRGYPAGKGLRCVLEWKVMADVTPVAALIWKVVRGT